MTGMDGAACWDHFWDIGWHNVGAIGPQVGHVLPYVGAPGHVDAILGDIPFRMKTRKTNSIVKWVWFLVCLTSAVGEPYSAILPGCVITLGIS